MIQVVKPTVVYAENTPNPTNMKFVANYLLLPDGLVAEYNTKEQAKGSPLATALFNFPFVKSVFISGNYVAIGRNDSVVWDDMVQEVREFVKEFLSAGNKAVDKLPEPVKNEQTGKLESNSDHTQPTTDDEKKIVEVLEQYIRPAVEQDGGLITFKSFEDGIVKVQMRGACSGCPSSTMTLKAGIEALLKRMVPSVKEVVSEAA